MITNAKLIFSFPRIAIVGAPEGVDALVLAEAARARPGTPILHVARDEGRMTRLADGLAFFAPEAEVLRLPAWDCLPYDRVSPNGAVVSRRIDTLSRLATPTPDGGPRVVLTTVSAALQRLPPRVLFATARLAVARGDTLAFEDLTGFLAANGFQRAETVREPGEYAVRGGLIDVFPPGTEEPVRIDLFGEVVDDIRRFDALSQRTVAEVAAVTLRPVSEVLLDDAAIARFRTGYRELFGTAGDDPLYEAISAGRRHVGFEHWLALFHDGLETLADYLPDAVLTLDYQCAEAVAARQEQITEYYETRRSFLPTEGARAGEAGTVYKPVPPDRLYLTAAEWGALVAGRPGGVFSPFDAPADGGIAVGGRRGTDFAAHRARADANLFDAVGARIAEHRAAGRQVLIAAYSAGTRDRLAGLLADHAAGGTAMVADGPALASLAPGDVAMAVLDLEHGFTLPALAVITEQDILGERMTRAARPRRRAENFITEASSLAARDLVVHVEHGIGRYQGLETLDIAGAPHDCLCVIYGGGDKLFVPVENIEVLSRYGADQGGAVLDKLGGAAWQTRKAKVKARIRNIAGRLLKVAAERQTKRTTPLSPPEGLYEEFCARFPFPETEDQLRAIDDTFADLLSGRAMDRLICGDVGFGKTEVALRAAFLAVMGGLQVAVVVPTTLLCRQHFETFTDRFAGLPVRIAQLSRFVAAKQAAEVKAALGAGEIDIVIGTHALLGKAIRFDRLGLLVVDEEQHFGVTQKERLKELRSDVHVLSMTATPIPRTLQLALAGVREMSLIATPPVDRLAVRTFVLPYDPVVVREAILREHFRGGQSFYVGPRIEDLARIERRLEALVPEVKIATAHGRMPAKALERVMTAFYGGRLDVLLCTNIIESGLDIPTANTLIVHRADMFGLSQLYQLRGRIGRAKTRAYAYLTLPPQTLLGEAANRRLHVMQMLDSLGAGFTLASHDLDIRGAGNLLGEEQSGHIREVGIELYQTMLEETVTELRAVAEAGQGESPAGPRPAWTPQITIGSPILIPETYVADLGVRLGLYRRLASLRAQAAIEGFAAELIDRFGKLPIEVENLIQIIEIKLLCYEAGISKVEVGPKGAVLAFHDNRFANPAGLIAFIATEPGAVKLRPDHRLVYRADWHRDAERIAGLRELVQTMVAVATESCAA